MIYFIITSCRNNGGIKIGEYLLPFSSDYKLKPEQGIDSDVGTIESNNITIAYNYGYYTSTIVETSSEYLNNGAWKLDAYSYAINPKGSYTTEITKEIKLLSTTTVKTHADSVKFKDADVIATCQLDTMIFTYGIRLPDKIKDHTFFTDTINGYYRKIIIAKDPTKGITGLYVKNLRSFDTSINSYLALGAVAGKLSKLQQDSLVRVFKRLSIIKNRQ